MTRRDAGRPGLGAYYPSALIGARQGPAPAQDAPSAPAGVDGMVVGELIAALGRADFPLRFARACQSLFRAEHATAFLIEERRCVCLLARRADGSDLTADRSRIFEDHYGAHDPFWQSARDDPAPYLDAMVRREDVADAQYLRWFGTSPRAAAKVAILARQAQRRWYFNFYVRSRVGSGLTDTIAALKDHRPILAETLAAHARTLGHAEPVVLDAGWIEEVLRRRFPMLSPREVEVCALTAAGSSVEDIAAALAVSQATVATFRRRAYAKLGIGSQRELFADIARHAGAAG